MNLELSILALVHLIFAVAALGLLIGVRFPEEAAAVRFPAFAGFAIPCEGAAAVAGRDVESGTIGPAHAGSRQSAAGRHCLSAAM
ncbi:MAG: hypothetical protein AB7S92_22125 [Parvibaculaceae bacterium]